jgi:hypothetical protein
VHGVLNRINLRKLRAMTQADRIGDYLQGLTPPIRNSLLTELERLKVCGDEMPGTAIIVEKLSTEFRKDGRTSNRAPNSSYYFFAPLEALLVDGAPEHANSGLILRGSLPAIWEWISRDLLPTMAHKYTNTMTVLIAADNQREARQVATAFRTKVVKHLESRLGSPDAIEQTRSRLANYTASRSAYGDLTKMICMLRARDALVKFSDALPARIDKFDGAWLANISGLLDTFGKTHVEALPFALALVAKRLRTSWHLMRLATRAAPSKNAADIAAARYAITVSMVLDRLDDKRSMLHTALKNNQVLAAKEILAEIYDIEHAVRVHIDLLDQSDWGARLNHLMSAIAVLVAAGVSQFSDTAGRVPESRSLLSHQSLAERMTYLKWKARGAVSGGAAFCKKLISRTSRNLAV